MDEHAEIRKLKQQLAAHEAAISQLCTEIDELRSKLGLAAKQRPKAPR